MESVHVALLSLVLMAVPMAQPGWRVRRFQAYSSATLPIDEVIAQPSSQSP